MREHARTWTDVGRLPLSRRDRAAMVLAYECIRDPRRRRPGSIEQVAIDALPEDMRAAWEVSRFTGPGVYGGRSWRLLRARLALALRALLRADAGEDGRVCWTCDGWRWVIVGRERELCPACGGSGSAPWRPLWEAPEARRA
jgi:hypothetical protein